MFTRKRVDNCSITGDPNMGKYKNLKIAGKIFGLIAGIIFVSWFVYDLVTPGGIIDLTKPVIGTNFEEPTCTDDLANETIAPEDVSATLSYYKRGTDPSSWANWANESTVDHLNDIDKALLDDLIADETTPAGGFAVRFWYTDNGASGYYGDDGITRYLYSRWHSVDLNGPNNWKTYQKPYNTSVILYEAGNGSVVTVQGNGAIPNAAIGPDINTQDNFTMVMRLDAHIQHQYEAWVGYFDYRTWKEVEPTVTFTVGTADASLDVDLLCPTMNHAQLTTTTISFSTHAIYASTPLVFPFHFSDDAILAATQTVTKCVKSIGVNGMG
jgi:hypothetical protein